MKTKHLALAVASVMMAACSQNEIMDGSQGNNSTIGFSVYTSTQTRGTDTDFEAVKSGHFGIMAYYTGTEAWSADIVPNVMYNQEVTHSTEGWTYSPIKYWPEEEGSMISFFAYAPYTNSNGIALSANDAVGAPSLTFTVNGDPTKMIDLVTDAKKDRKQADGKVPFSLKHVLSRVTFAATALVESGKTTISVKSAKVLTGASLYETATNEIGGDWTYTEATKFAADYSLDNILNLTDAALVLNTTGTALSLFKENEYLFLIPVSNATGTVENEDVQVEFTYEVKTTDESLAGGAFTVTNTKTVSLPQGALKKGKAYKYTFNFSPKAIEVEATEVAEWGTEESL